MPYALGGLLARWTLLLRQWRDSPAAEAAFQAHAPMQFYDTWVARDAEGELLDKHAPFARRVAAPLPNTLKTKVQKSLKRVPERMAGSSVVCPERRRAHL